jgi:hypothetical protein
MPHYAMVTVVKADDPEKAYDWHRYGQTEVLEFVGEPWEVTPVNAPDEDSDPDHEGYIDPQFGTLDCLEQHPEN